MQQSIIDQVIWFQRDAAFCYAIADELRKKPAHEFIAVHAQVNAAQSAAEARRILSNNED
jgi:hypothetical protein